MIDIPEAPPAMEGKTMKDVPDTPPVKELLTTLEELQILTDELCATYDEMLVVDPVTGLRLHRWQLRVLAAFRAAGKAQANTEESIRKLEHHVANDP